MTIESRIILETVDGQQLALVSMRDVTERKTWETQQKLLLRELTHRVKNTLTVVQAIAHQTQRFSKSFEEFTDRLDGRLGRYAEFLLGQTLDRFDRGSARANLRISAPCSPGRYWPWKTL